MTDAIEAGARAILDRLNEVAPAVENLASNQQQVDMDGFMVKVSRQAIDEVLTAINDIAIMIVTAPPAIASGALVPASAGPFTEGISTLAHRFWSIYPSEIAAKNLTREEFYAREMTKLVQKATANAVAEMRERCVKAIRDAVCSMDWPPDDGDKLIDELQAAIRQLDIAPSSGDYVEGWRTMDSAPKDGTPLILRSTFRVGEGSWGICRPQHDGYRANDGKPTWRTADEEKIFPGAVNGWMPMPPLNAASSNGGEK